MIKSMDRYDRTYQERKGTETHPRRYYKITDSRTRYDRRVVCMVSNKTKTKTEIIIKISDVFDQKSSDNYPDEDLSTLGAKEVYEAIVIIDNTVVISLCRLVKYDPTIKSPVITRETFMGPGQVRHEWREATITEVENAIHLLEISTNGTEEPIRMLKAHRRDMTIDTVLYFPGDV